jgi:SAM-dependent methyltransferase
MRNSQLNRAAIHHSAPSQFVSRFASQIASNASGMPILDVACGSGRNAIVFSQLGCSVICLDIDLSRLDMPHSTNVMAERKSYQLDLVHDPWPLGPRSVGGIINVHFLLPALFPYFERSLIPGGYLLLETIPGCGGNHVQLPKVGELRSALSSSYDLEFYKERRVGPIEYGAVTVHLLAKHKYDSAA